MNTDDFKMDVEQANEIRRAAVNKHEARRSGTKLSPRVTPKRVEGLGGRRLAKRNLGKGSRLGGRKVAKK